MDKLNYFYDVNLCVLFGCVFIFLFLASLSGLFLGRRFAKTFPNRLTDVSDFIPSTILGLLSLIMGFTFSMAISRFEHRKELVLKEANAIGTVYLRSELLNSDKAEEARSILKKYVDVRLEFFAAGDDFARIEEAEGKAQQLQKNLWALAVQMTRSDKTPIQGLFDSAINELIDLQAERLFALQNTVPKAVNWVILLLASIGLSSRYFTKGMQGKGSRAGAALLAVFFGLVFALIHDLDRPRSGLTTVSQETMMSFRKSLNQQR